MFPIESDLQTRLCLSLLDLIAGAKLPRLLLRPLGFAEACTRPRNLSVGGGEDDAQGSGLRVQIA